MTDYVLKECGYVNGKPYIVCEEFNEPYLSMKYEDWIDNKRRKEKRDS